MGKDIEGDFAERETNKAWNSPLRIPTFIFQIKWLAVGKAAK